MIGTPQFDSTWRRTSAVKEVPRSIADSMIRRHYLHKWPGVCRCVLVMVAKDEPVGVLVYAEPPRETNVRYGGRGFELARLWIDDSVPRNAETWFIAQSVKYVNHKWPELSYLVSYADPSAGHRGTIYKAANWKFDGMTDAGRKTPRCDYVDERGKKYSRRSHIPNGVQVRRIPRVSKYRFVYRLHGVPKMRSPAQRSTNSGSRPCQQLALELV